MSAKVLNFGHYVIKIIAAKISSKESIMIITNINIIMSNVYVLFSFSPLSSGNSYLSTRWYLYIAMEIFEFWYIEAKLEDSEQMQVDVVL